MRIPFVKCACRRDFYPNQLKTVQGRTEKGEPVEHKLCRDCENELLFRFSSKDFVAGLIRRSMDQETVDKIRMERGEDFPVPDYQNSATSARIRGGVA